MATACVAPCADAFQGTALRQPKIRKQLKTGLAETARRGGEAGKYSEPRLWERCDSATVQCRASTPTLRVCNPSSPLSSALDPPCFASVCAATHTCLRTLLRVSRFAAFDPRTALPAPAQSLTSRAVNSINHPSCVIEGLCVGREPPTIDWSDSSTVLRDPSTTAII